MIATVLSVFFALLGCCRASNTWMKYDNTSLDGFGDLIQQNDEPNYRSAILNTESSSCTNNSLLCSTWSYCRNGTCECLNIPNYILNCDSLGQIRSILTCNCITYNEITSTLEIGSCIYNCNPKKKTISSYFYLLSNASDWNEIICGRFNRKGTLCGECKDGFYTAAYSYDLTCIKCTNTASNWLKFVLIAFLPLTVFYCVVLVFRINVHSTYLQGYVLYSQAVTVIYLARNLIIMVKEDHLWFKYIIYSTGTLYGIWNLDFFRFFSADICLQTGSLATVSLELVVAMYPLLLIFITYGMILMYDRKLYVIVMVWRPFKAFFSLFERNWDFKSSLIDAFSTFFFLLSIKCMSTCADFLLPVRVYQVVSPLHIHTEYRLYYDASISYFGPRHLPYAILALAVFFIVGLLPTLLLLLFSFKFCQRVLVIFPPTWKIYMHTFVDAIQGFYKDGTETGTHDYRWFAGLIFGARIMFIIMYGVMLNECFFVAVSAFLVLFSIVFVITDPYKANYNHLSSYFVIFLLLNASIYTMPCVYRHDDNVIVNAIVIVLLFFVSVIPIVYITILILLWFLHHSKSGWDVFKNLKAKLKGYTKVLT